MSCLVKQSYPLESLQESRLELANTSAAGRGIDPVGFFECIEPTCSKSHTIEDKTLNTER